MQGAMSDEEAALGRVVLDDTRQLQRDARAAKWMGGAALAFASAATALLLITAAASKAEPAARVAAGDALVGLSAAPGAPAPGAPAPPPRRAQGWFRMYLKTAVRNRAELGSTQLAVLPEGSLIYVQETQGQHARISRPVSGWLDMLTGDGVTVAHPDVALRRQAEAVDVRGIVESDRHKAHRKMVQAKVAQLTATQVRLASAVKSMKARAEALRGSPGRVAESVRSGAPQAAADLARRAGEAAKQVAESRDAREVLKGLSRQPGLGDFLK